MTAAALDIKDNPTLALLSQLGVEEQRVAQVAQVMSALQESQAEAQALEELRAENARLKELNQTLLAHSDFLAAAVGACPQCWGEDAECGECGGRGEPGAYVPERICFEEVVRPVLNRMRERLAARRRRSEPQAPVPPAPQSKES